MKIRQLYYFWTFIIIFICLSALWILKNDSFKTYGMEIGYRDKNLEKRLGYSLEEYLKSKSITSYNLNGSKENDDEIFKTFKSKIKEIKETGDYNQVLHIKFSKKSKYEDFIRTYEICKLEECETYIPDGYDFWIIPASRKVKIKKPMPK